MKKLMLAVAIVCAAVIAQAATVDWKVGALKNTKNYSGDGTSYFGAVQGDAFYLVIASYADTVTAALEGKTFTGSESGIISSVVNAGTKISTTYGGLTATTSDNSALLKADGETTYDFIALLVSTDAEGAQVWKYSTPAIDQVASTADSTTTLSWVTGDFASEWSKASGEAIPEPTSALMLLVGLAGLALKRKVA